MLSFVWSEVTRQNNCFGPHPVSKTGKASKHSSRPRGSSDTLFQMIVFGSEGYWRRDEGRLLGRRPRTILSEAGMSERRKRCRRFRGPSKFRIENTSPQYKNKPCTQSIGMFQDQSNVPSQFSSQNQIWPLACMLKTVLMIPFKGRRLSISYWIDSPCNTPWTHVFYTFHELFLFRLECSFAGHS
jgi:hypothetical protein